MAFLYAFYAEYELNFSVIFFGFVQLCVSLCVLVCVDIQLWSISHHLLHLNYPSVNQKYISRFN